MVMAETKRAYTEAAKQQREQKIISVAEMLLLEKGYYAINMDQVAQAATLAKGTVYLYFKTKEELFLTVFERQSIVWFEEIEQILAETLVGSPKETLVELLVKTLVDKPLLTRLVALSPIVFEFNISLERAREHKVWLFAKLARVGQLIETKFELQPLNGVQFLFRTFIIVAGLEGFARPSPIMQEVFDHEPTLTRIDFEVELKNLLLAILNVTCN
jgi:TetR/AcrR family transcriptional regulator